MKRFNNISFLPVFRVSRVLMIVGVACVFAASCGKDPSIKGEEPVDPAQAGTFKVASLTADETFKIVTRGDVAVGNFGVSLKNSGGELVKSWDSFSSMDPVVTVPSGTYTLEANSGNLKPAAFEAPYYSGTSEFKVAVQQLTNVDIVAALANIKVTVGYSESFLSQVRDVKVIVNNGVNAADGTMPGILTYTVDEVRAGYFAVPLDKVLSVQVTGFRIADSKPVSETIKIKDAVQQQWHKVTIDVSTVGTAQSVITINHELIDKDSQIVVPGADDLIPGNDDEWNELDPPVEPGPGGAEPTIVGASFNGVAFDFAQPLDIHVGTGASPVNNVLDVLLAAPTGGIKKLLLTIDCAALSGLLPMLGITGEIDLANPSADAEWATLFADASIGILDPNVPILGKTTHTFAVGGLMNMLGMVMSGDSESDKTASFTIKVVDGDGVMVTKVLRVVVMQ